MIYYYYYFISATMLLCFDAKDEKMGMRRHISSNSYTYVRFDFDEF